MQIIPVLAVGRVESIHAREHGSATDLKLKINASRELLPAVEAVLEGRRFIGLASRSALRTPLRRSSKAFSKYLQFLLRH